MIELEQIQNLLTQAGEIALDNFSKPDLSFDLKVDHSIVTEADLAIEKYLRSAINASFPEHAIIGEEYEAKSGDEYAWILDPIDGSAPFFWNIPTWCISIGITKNQQPYMGFVYVPLTRDLFYSMDNRSFLNGKLIQSSQVNEITSDSAFCVSTRALNKFQLINYEGMVFALGSGVFNNLMVARGMVIGALSLCPNIWDLAGAMKIVEGSGGEMVYLTGEPVDLAALHQIKRAPHPVLAAPRQLIRPLLSMIRLTI